MTTNLRAPVPKREVVTKAKLTKKKIILRSFKKTAVSTRLHKQRCASKCQIAELNYHVEFMPFTCWETVTA